MEDLVRIQDVSFMRNERSIFNHISMTIPAGKITAIMGPSGCGKTTLLRLIGGQLAPSEGSIYLQDQNVHLLTQKQLYTLRRKIGMLFQSGGLFTHLNVYENVAFPLREHTQLSEAMIRTLVLTKLQMVGLRGARSLMPSQLSGGMARRVALARAIILDPTLIMYDEPFAGQDPISMGVLVSLIKDLNAMLGITSIIVSHDVPETLSIAHKAYVIAEGNIIGHGTSDSIKQSDSAQLKQFLYGLPDGPVPFHYQAPPITQELLS